MNNNIYTRGITYPHHFFWAPLEQIEQVYELDRGLLAAGTRGNNVEVLWGVRKFSELQTALERVKQDYATFLFRIGGTLQEVQKRQQEVVRWGYELQLTHVGYTLHFFESLVAASVSQAIGEFQPHEKGTILALSQQLFPLFALSEQELANSLDDSATHLFIARVGGEVVGYVYGRIVQNQQGFIRELGVHPMYRRQGWASG